MSVSGIFFLAGKSWRGRRCASQRSHRFFRTVKQHFGSLPPSETVELGRDCSLGSFAIEPAYLPLAGARRYSFAVYAGAKHH